MKTSVELFGFWRSLASYRVRIALALKGVVVNETSVNLLEGEQFKGEVARLNPQNSLPVVLHEDTSLTQSLAILEYLEECFPSPPLLPTNPIDRAVVRSFALITIADAHPLIVPRARKRLVTQFNASDEAVDAWAQHWLRLGLEAMETRLQERQRSTRFCFTDSPSIADIGLASHVAGASFFGVDMNKFLAINATMTQINELDEFISTAPLKMKANAFQPVAQ